MSDDEWDQLQPGDTIRPRDGVTPYVISRDERGRLIATHTVMLTDRGRWEVLTKARVVNAVSQVKIYLSDLIGR